MAKKRSIRLFSKTVLFFNILAVLCLLLSYLAPVTDPIKFWPIAFFGLAYPFFLLINIAFIVYWLFRKVRFALISFVAILLGWGILMNYCGFRESTGISVPKSSQSFMRVLTYNVHSFKQFGSDNDTYTKDKILDIIRNEKPDVICFQEFFTRYKGEYNFRKLISELMNSNNYYFVPNVDNGYEAMGMAIFSKYPIKNKGRIEFKGVSGNEAIYADLKVGDKTVRVYNVHFQSINFQPEDYKYLDKVKKEASTSTQSTRRIGSRLKQAFLKRSEQVKQIKEHSQECKTPYVIAGDFNDTPISYAVKTLSSGLNNSFREKGSGFGVTYNGDFPNFQIDYILSSPEFEVKNNLIIKKKLSDHYAVRSDLELK